MKKKTLFAALALLAGLTAVVQNYDFSAITSGGDTLYYNILTDTTVQVTMPATGWTGFGTPPAH